MAATPDDWSTDSNNAVNISLVIPSENGLKTLHSFNPKMTYSIFEEETIFGYQGLKINLRYNACDMRPSLQIGYTRKFPAVGETTPADLRAILEPYLPKVAFGKAKDFEGFIKESSSATWKPPGELLKTLDVGGETYEIWKGSLADSAVNQLVKRIQILVPLFIEGGTAIELEDPESLLERWTVFFLYQKNTKVTRGVSPYVFMGYSTVFRYFFFQPITKPDSPAELTQTNKASTQTPLLSKLLSPPDEKEESGTSPIKTSDRKEPINRLATSEFTLPVSENITFFSQPCRPRISQFVILPPFQKGGNGSRFYQAIFKHYSQQPQTIEIAVEDPNERFDDLRDINDLAYLRTLPEFLSLCNISSQLSTGWRPGQPAPKDIIRPSQLETVRKKAKIAQRQFLRLVEMQLLSLIPSGIRQSLTSERPIFEGDDLKARKREYHLWQILVKRRLYRHNKDSLMQLDRTERLDKLEATLASVELDYARLLTKLDEGIEKGAEVHTNGNGAVKRSLPGDEAEEYEGPSAKKVKTTT